MTSFDTKIEEKRPVLTVVGSPGSEQASRSQTGPLRVSFGFGSPIWSPPTDVFDTGDEIIVRVEIAGMREQNFSILLDGRRLLISGLRNLPQERCAYHQMEISSGEFRIEVDLPHPVVMDQVEAAYKDGFLRIALPKAKPKRIHIEE